MYQRFWSQRWSQFSHATQLSSIAQGTVAAVQPQLQVYRLQSLFSLVATKTTVYEPSIGEMERLSVPRSQIRSAQILLGFLAILLNARDKQLLELVQLAHALMAVVPV